MAEFVLAPLREVDVIPPDDGNSTAILFFCQQILAKEQDDLQTKFDFITKELSQNPVFVLDKSQSFEHKQSRTENGIHRHEREQMLKELDLLLPPEVRVMVKKHATSRMEDGSKSQPSDAAAVSNQCPARYIRYKKALGKPSSQNLEACFIHLPSWDTLEVQYLSLNVSPKPKSRLSFYSREETLEIDGKRSIKRYSMISSTAIQAMQVASQEVGSTGEFYKKIHKYKHGDFSGATAALPPLESRDDRNQSASQQQEPKQSSSSCGEPSKQPYNKCMAKSSSEKKTSETESSVDPENGHQEKPT